MKVVAVGEGCCKQSQASHIHTHRPPFIHPTVEQYQFHLLMRHVCFKTHENHTRLRSYLPDQLGSQWLARGCWHSLASIAHCTVSLTVSEGNHVSYDFNWLRLNEVICRYYVTFCNSCMRCVADCSLRRKLTTYSLHCTWLGGLLLETGMAQLEEV